MCGEYSTRCMISKIVNRNRCNAPKRARLYSLQRTLLHLDWRISARQERRRVVFPAHRIRLPRSVRSGAQPLVVVSPYRFVCAPPQTFTNRRSLPLVRQSHAPPSPVEGLHSERCANMPTSPATSPNTILPTIPPLATIDQPPQTLTHTNHPHTLDHPHTHPLDVLTIPRTNHTPYPHTRT